jgi:hypothetical protein
LNGSTVFKRVASLAAKRHGSQVTRYHDRISGVAANVGLSAARVFLA